MRLKAKPLTKKQKQVMACVIQCLPRRVILKNTDVSDEGELSKMLTRIELKGYIYKTKWGRFIKPLRNLEGYLL